MITDLSTPNCCALTMRKLPDLNTKMLSNNIVEKISQGRLVARAKGLRSFKECDLPAFEHRVKARIEDTAIGGERAADSRLVP